MRRWIHCASLAALAALFCATGAAGQDASSVSLGVVPFERNAPLGAAVPDVETLLADRIGTLGVKKVVGPAEFEIVADAEPDDATVQTWAHQADVAAVVAGRITRIGNQMSVDVRLRSGETGAAAGTYVAEVVSPDRLDAVVDSLAKQIVEGAVRLAAQSAPAAAVPAAPAPTSGGGSFGIPFDGDRPISIRSDELQSFREGGSRRLIFTKNVVVTQDGLTIRSNRLVAIYPPKTSQPSRMEATGRVRMANGDNEARCDRATYERAKNTLICRGNAELQEGADCVTGNWIEFDLTAETVKVGGGATVILGGTNGARPGGACR